MKRLLLAAALLALPTFGHAQTVGDEDQRIHYFECYAKCASNRPYEYCQKLCSCATSEVAKLSKADYDRHNEGMGKGGTGAAQAQTYVKKVTEICHKNARSQTN